MRTYNLTYPPTKTHLVIKYVNGAGPGHWYDGGSSGFRVTEVIHVIYIAFFILGRPLEPLLRFLRTPRPCLPPDQTLSIVKCCPSVIRFVSFCQGPVFLVLLIFREQFIIPRLISVRELISLLVVANIDLWVLWVSFDDKGYINFLPIFPPPAPPRNYTSCSKNKDHICDYIPSCKSL